MNTVTILGRLTQDPKIEVTKTEKFYILFNVASDDKGSTNFIPCIAFDATAETIGNYVKKGQRIFIKGNMQSYKKADNNSAIIVNVESFEFADSKKTIEPASTAHINSNTDFIEEVVNASANELPF